MFLFKALLGGAGANECVLSDISEQFSCHASHQHEDDFKMMTACDLL